MRDLPYAYPQSCSPRCGSQLVSRWFSSHRSTPPYFRVHHRSLHCGHGYQHPRVSGEYHLLHRGTQRHLHWQYCWKQHLQHILHPRHGIHHRPLTMGGITFVDWSVMLLSALTLLISSKTFEKRQLDRKDAIIFLLIYAGYMVCSANNYFAYHLFDFSHKRATFVIPISKFNS